MASSLYSVPFLAAEIFFIRASSRSFWVGAAALIRRVLSMSISRSTALWSEFPSFSCLEKTAYFRACVCAMWFVVSI